MFQPSFHLLSYFSRVSGGICVLVVCFFVVARPLGFLFVVRFPGEGDLVRECDLGLDGEGVFLGEGVFGLVGDLDGEGDPLVFLGDGVFGLLGDFECDLVRECDLGLDGEGGVCG